tara:strand:- start:91 stop:582 length:492 start_codon:yes stop_codon:yes gene_type:complete
LKKSFVFVTTGTQLPFNRMIDIVDNWAAAQPNVDVIAQTANSTESYEHITTVDFLSPEKYDEYTTNAEVIIGHAGMGTIITGFEKNKPLILMARKFIHGEHRNDHQQSTVNKFDGIKGIYIANDENELNDLLLRYKELEPASDENINNRANLIGFLKNTIAEA